MTSHERFCLELILDWLGWGEGSEEPPPMNQSEPANVEDSIQRGSQQALSSEEIDNLSTEEQVKLGYGENNHGIR